MIVLLALLFIGSIYLANLAISVFGLVPVFPGLAAPAGVYFAGLTFTLRDLIQIQSSRKVVIGCIVVGAILSATISGSLALASGCAFLVSELLDFGIYTPLRKKGLIVAVLVSNLVGLTVDSIAFLWLAFGNLSFLPGQIVGKLWITLVTVGVLYGVLSRYPSSRMVRILQRPTHGIQQNSI